MVYKTQSNSAEINAIIVKRQVENEAVFRTENEKHLKALAQFNELAESEGEHSLTTPEESVLHFICECSDENCDQRVAMTISEYVKTHKDRSCFIVIPGHETLEVEKPVMKKMKFTLVKKFFKPTSKNPVLKSTPTDNV